MLIFLSRADEDCMFNFVLFFTKRWHIIPYEHDEHQQLHQMIHLSLISISESFLFYYLLQYQRMKISNPVNGMNKENIKQRDSMLLELEIR